MDEEFDTSSDVSSDVDTEVSDVEFDDTDTSDVSDDIPEDDYSNDEDFADDTDGDYKEDIDSLDEDVDVENDDFTEDDVETEDIAEDSISEIEEDSETENFDDELSDVDDDIEENTEDSDETEDMEPSEEMDEIEEDAEEFQETDEETDGNDEVIEEDVEDVAEDAATETEEGVAEDTATETEEVVAEETAVETEEAVTEETVAETEEIAEDTATDTEEDEAEDTTSETEEGATEDTTTETEEDVAEETATETEKGVAEETATETEEDAVEDTATETEEGTAEETTTETEEGADEDISVETEEGATEDTTTNVEEGVAEETTTETEEDTAEGTAIETEEGAVEETATETEEYAIEETASETEESIIEEIANEVEEGTAEETITETEEGTAEEGVAGDTTAETQDDVVENTTTETSVEQEIMDDFAMYESDNMVANESNENVSEMDEENLKDNSTELYETNPEATEEKKDAVEASGGTLPSNPSESVGSNPPPNGPVCPVCGQDPCVCGDIHEDDKTSFEKLSEYMNEHNYGPDDFASYSQDPVWRTLHREVYPDYEMPELSQENARTQLSEYMNEHNYGIDDFETYSQDPVWRELHGAAYPDYEMPAEKGNNDVVVEFVSGKKMIEQFGTEKHRYGSDYFVKGDHYDQFESDYYTQDNSTYTEYEIPQERDISPSLIEGIHLGKSEVENPSIFWEQHEKGGTAESFQEIASHIPEVRERLASGDSLDDLANDEKLSECASIYFKNKPQVIERDGYYEFDSNGRHRIMATRALGYDIPVSVVGKRSYNESESDAFEAPFFDEGSELESDGSVSDDSLHKNELTEDFELKTKIPRTEFDSKEYSSMADALEKNNVEFRPIQLAQQNRTPQDIINRLSGGDMTRGSCSSLALAYAGNKAGYDVLDFRDGDSRSFFSSRSSIQMIADMPGIKSSVLQGTNDMVTANQLLSNMQEGKEYYLATGGHAAIVRNNGTNYEYLELQHPSNGNGWHVLNNNILQHRFGCRETRPTACTSFLMEVESMTNSKEFKNILGFINTAEFKQRKGGAGNVR